MVEGDFQDLFAFFQTGERIGKLQKIGFLVSMSEPGKQNVVLSGLCTNLLSTLDPENLQNKYSSCLHFGKCHQTCKDYLHTCPELNSDEKEMNSLLILRQITRNNIELR